jgi:hypothetical protein
MMMFMKMMTAVVPRFEACQFADVTTSTANAPKLSEGPVFLLADSKVKLRDIRP